MKVLFVPAFFFLSSLPAAAGDPTSQGMVGVLMDANCPAIADGSRHAEPAPTVTASAHESKRRRTAPREGTRGRSLASRAAGDSDRFDSCKATAGTNAFAIHTDGQLLMLDEEGNEVVRQQMRNDSFRASMVDDSGTPRWLTVMVDGRRIGDKLTITSIRR